MGEQKQSQNILMKEENELKGSKKLKCFQRGIFNQKIRQNKKKGKKKTHEWPHYVFVAHNSTQNARLHVLLLLDSNISSYLLMES